MKSSNLPKKVQNILSEKKIFDHDCVTMNEYGQNRRELHIIDNKEKSAGESIIPKRYS